MKDYKILSIGNEKKEIEKVEEKKIVTVEKVEEKKELKPNNFFGMNKDNL